MASVISTKSFGRKITPKAAAVYPKLTKPDTKFKEDGEWSCNVKVDAGDFSNLKNFLDECIEKAFEEAKAGLIKAKKAADAKKLTKADAPYEEVYDDEGNETGEMFVKIKRGAKIRFTDKKTGEKVEKDVTIPKFDAKGKPIKPDVWGGSTVKVSFEAVPYYMASTKAAGVTLRLVAVQVLELVTKGSAQGSAGDFGFGEEEGFESDGSDGGDFEDESEDAAADDAADEDEDEDGDDDLF